MILRPNTAPRRGFGERFPAGLRGPGFTLVEIMVAMSILALVLVAIYSTWTAILRSSKVGLDAAAAVQRARIAARVIEESLGSTVSFNANQQLYGFDAENGSEAYLTFVSHLSKSFPRSGKFGDLDVRRVTFSLERGTDGGDQLVLRQTPVLMETDRDEKDYPLVLAKNVKKFAIDFWDLRQQEWVDEWKDTNQLPVLVKVTLRLTDKPSSAKVREEVVRIVSLPSVAVAPIWQSTVGGPGTPGMPGAVPPGGRPGMTPGGLQPGMNPPGMQLNPGQFRR
jgi:general secretion pathway protein J